MNFKDLLDEALNRGEKLKDEILDEVENSTKILKHLVSNPGFVNAVSRVIETTDEVKKVIQKQVKGLFQAMNVPSKSDFTKVGHKLAAIEKSIEHFGAKKIQIKKLIKPAAKKAAAKKVFVKKAVTRKSGKTKAGKK